MAVRSLLCSIVVLSSLVSSAAAAQEARGTIQGRVIDPSGGAVPGALVEILNIASIACHTAPKAHLDKAARR